MKPDYKKITAFVVESLDLEYLEDAADTTISTPKQAFKDLKKVYLAEYGHELAGAKNYQQTFAAYLQGLPSCVNIPFANSDILKLAVEWGSLPEGATRAQEEKILENYWLFMATQYGKEARKHGVSLFF